MHTPLIPAPGRPPLNPPPLDAVQCSLPCGNYSKGLLASLVESKALDHFKVHLWDEWEYSTVVAERTWNNIAPNTSQMPIGGCMHAPMLLVSSYLDSLLCFDDLLVLIPHGGLESLGLVTWNRVHQRHLGHNTHTHTQYCTSHTTHEQYTNTHCSYIMNFSRKTNDYKWHTLIVLQWATYRGVLLPARSHWFRDIGVQWHQFQHCCKYSRDAVSYMHGEREKDGQYWVWGEYT